MGGYEELLGVAVISYIVGIASVLALIIMFVKGKFDDKRAREERRTLESNNQDINYSSEYDNRGK